MTSRILRLFGPLRVTHGRWRARFKGAALKSATLETPSIPTLAIERTPLEQVLLGASREGSAAIDKTRKSAG